MNGMLRRFSLYGFLKNQQYYEPFFLLAFLQMGLNYTLIGILIGFREVMVNLMEIPTGAIADLFGRRKAMISSFASYIVSFAIMGAAGLASTSGHLSRGTLLLFLLAAMAFFAVGDAFRTGTHKAMIFTWLRIQGRSDERTKVYGYTRSWSKIGSAVSVVVASVVVFTTRNFIYVFFFSIIPYLLNIINFAGYPAEVDGNVRTGTSLRDVIRHLGTSLRSCMRQAGLRRLLLESMGFEGFFKATKDYLQPILKSAAIPLTAVLFSGAALSEHQQAVVLVGPVYFVLFLLSAVASRKAHVFVGQPGQEDNAARLLWGLALLLLGLTTVAMVYGWYWAMIPAYVFLYVTQNLWRPILISRFDAHGNAAGGATILSVESQAKSAATMVFAPALGFAVDMAKSHGLGATEFWPIGLFGTAVALVFFLTAQREHNQ